MILILIFLVALEFSIRYLEIIKPACFFADSKLSSNLNYFEKKQICDEYKLQYERSQPFATPKPNQMGDYVNINSEGFRGKEVDFSDNEYRIFFLGGSTTFGIVTTSDDKSIPGQVERILKVKGFDVKIINAGVGFATTLDEKYILKEKILQHKPDMIIMYDGWNDVSHINELKFQISYDEYLKNNDYRNKEIGTKKPTTEGTGIIKFFEKINYRTAIGIASYVKDPIRQIYSEEITQTSSLGFSSEKLSKIQSNMIGNWSEICDLGEKNEFVTVNIIQPILGTADRNIHPDEIKLLDIRDDAKYLKKLNFNKGLESCENVIDLRNALSGQDGVLFYYDGGHMSDFGYSVIAEKIVDKIIPIIKNNYINQEM